MEGMSSLLVVQKLGQVGKELIEEEERWQFGLLVGAAAAYVTSAWWIVVVRARTLLRWRATNVRFSLTRRRRHLHCSQRY